MANFVYLIGDQSTKEVFIVDPAWQMDTLFKLAEKEDLKIKGALITHSHFDHCNGIEELLSKINLPIYIQEEEANFVKSLGPRTDRLFGSFPEENLKKVHSGDQVQIGKITITFLHTPGHTPGSQCFLVQNNLVAGDTLFVRGCGRCDLPGGSAQQMYESLTKKLMPLMDDTILFPGHHYSEEAFSLLGVEKKKNPYFLCNTLEAFLTMTGGRL
jgi:glyoxylase-like metal-dependent hydrolase (beta-lactamase superfamily II)